MFKIFISYAQAQMPWVEDLRKRLSAPGVQVFVAEHDVPAGSSLSTSISSALNDSDLIIPLWTVAAADSKYVNAELFHAKTSGKPILPIRIDSEVPLPTFLGDVKYLDMAKGPESQLKWLSDYVGKLSEGKKQGQFLAWALLGFLAFIMLKSDS